MEHHLQSIKKINDGEKGLNLSFKFIQKRRKKGKEEFFKVFFFPKDPWQQSDVNFDSKLELSQV